MGGREWQELKKHSLSRSSHGLPEDLFPGGLARLGNPSQCDPHTFILRDSTTHDLILPFYLRHLTAILSKLEYYILFILCKYIISHVDVPQVFDNVERGLVFRSQCFLIASQCTLVHRLCIFQPAVLSVDVCPGPHAFSLPASARLYIISASFRRPWLTYMFPSLFTVLSVDVCSGPIAFS